MSDGWWDAGVLDRERLGPLVEPTIERARAARDRDAFPHALLLVGPAGLGRELAAVEVAVLLTLPELEGRWPESPAARRLRAGTHPDVVAVRPSGAAGRIGIDQIRGVVETASGRPFEGARRVWIVDGAEAGRLGAEAANAFLKILEEPPPHVAFVLLAANPTAVLPTIRSRCQRLLLPGPTAVARVLGNRHPVPDLPAEAAASWLADARTAIEASLGGDPRGLLQLPERLPAEPVALSVVAAAALELAASSPDDRADDLTRLAADLLRLEDRARRLNLVAARQLVARLAAFHRDSSR